MDILHIIKHNKQAYMKRILYYDSRYGADYSKTIRE